eukprot:UN19465
MLVGILIALPPLKIHSIFMFTVVVKNYSTPTPCGLICPTEFPEITV